MEHPERKGSLARLATGSVVALTLAATAPAATSAPAAPPRYWIETIEVVTERLSPEIVLSESLLEEGREYGENELRDGMRRIHRLPFVLLAEMSLARGSERGRYALRIQVWEVRRWFFRIDRDEIVHDELFRFDRPPGSGFDTGIGSDPTHSHALAGRRFALGRRSLLFATVGGESGLAALGYQRYDLFDRSILLTATLAAESPTGVIDQPTYRGRLELGAPLRGNHGVRLRLDGSQTDFDLLGAGGDLRFRGAEAELAWVFNSLDDPILPRQGAFVETGLLVQRRDSRQTILGLEGQRVQRQFREDRVGVRAAATKSWPLGRLHSLSAGGRTFVVDSSFAEREFIEVEAGLGFETFLVRKQDPGGWRELRYEMRLSATSQQTPGLDSGTLRRDIWRARAGLVFRHSWGIYRLFIDYVDVGRPR